MRGADVGAERLVVQGKENTSRGRLTRRSAPPEEPEKKKLGGGRFLS